MLLALPGSGRPTSAGPGRDGADPGGTDDAAIARLLAGSHPRIARRDAPWRVTRPLRIPAGTTVTIEPGTHFLCALPPGSPAAPIGVFEAGGDDVAILVEGGEAIVECTRPSPFVYAAAMRGHRGFTVAGLAARECQHVWVAAAVDDFDRIRTEGQSANVARDVRIRGGGARYAVSQKQGHGACLLQYVVGCDVRGAAYANVSHGVEWWGGNADPVQPPAQGMPGTERKCRSLLIENVSVRNAAGGGIWGSMGENVVVRDCRIEEIGDVGFDAEGSNTVLFERCEARNARNGCFTTFFLCNGVRFVDCRGVVDNKAFPLVRIYNSTQSNADNRRVEIAGGHFECLDTTGPGAIDTAMGPVREFVLTGATLSNVRVDTAFFNMHLTRIVGNELTFPYPIPVDAAAIRAGSSRTAGTSHGVVPGGVIIANNRIRSTAPASGTAAILLREDDFNGSAVDRIRGNLVSGGFGTGIAVTNATGNVGIVPSFAITANRFTGLPASARLLSAGQEGKVARPPVVTWDDAQTRDGRPVRLAQALGRDRGTPGPG